FAALVVAALMVAALKQMDKPQTDPAQPGTHMVANRLANGAIVFEEVPDESTLQDIAPAAGSAEDEPRFKYDPLTQTYRAKRADGGQDIIRDPLNPSKN